MTSEPIHTSSMHDFNGLIRPFDYAGSSSFVIVLPLAGLASTPW